MTRKKKKTQAKESIEDKFVMSYLDGIDPDQNWVKGDYHDEETGLLTCSKCDTAKQIILNLGGFEKVVPIICECESEEIRKAEQKEKEQAMKAWKAKLRREGIMNPDYLYHTFENDDSPDSVPSKTARQYARKFDEMSKKGIGILFFGDVGTGKSFYACAIANYIIDHGRKALVTSMPRLQNRLWSENDKQAVIDELQEFELLVIDDLGAERASEYSLEQVFLILDTWSLSKKPLILTTNLSLEELNNPSGESFRRIYDRVIEMTPIQVAMIGESRRKKNAAKARQEALNILWEQDK